MEKFKISNYESEHGAGSFPAFRHLSRAEIDQTLYSLKQRMGLDANTTSKDLAIALRNNSVTVEGFSAGQDHFDLWQLLRQLEISNSEKVFLNWYHFGEVDEMHTRDVVRCFTGLWYPSSDDMDIVDANLEWALLVEHDGRIGLNRFAP